jgi:trans-aconitate methyltransferase
LQLGFEVTVLDIADAALEVSRRRLGAAARMVDWQVADITTWRPARRYDLWHDRAVFHFLTAEADRAAYKAALRTGLKAGGWLVMATFAEDGPEKCSGLAVQRYSAESLQAELGSGFELKRHERESHLTPWGSAQMFTWTLFRRTSGARR